MKFYRRLPLLVLLIAASAVLLTACMGGGTAIPNWPGMSVNAAGDTAYVAYGTHVYAVNTANGAEMWRFPVEANNKITFSAAPAFSTNDQLVVGSYSNTLYGLNLSNGQQAWVFNGATGQYVAQPLVTDQGIFAPAADGNLYALDLAGNLKWKFETKRPLWATPVLNGDVIYLSALDHHVYALDSKSGRQFWITEDLGGSIAGSPVLGEDGVMYVGIFNNALMALDTQNGKVLWKIATSGWIWSGPLLNEGVLYFGDLNGTLYSVNASTGSLNWSKQLDQSKERAIIDRPLLVGDTLYYCSEVGNFYAVDPASGTPRWTEPKALGGKLYTSPVAVGDQILISIMQGKSLVVALDHNGNQKWAYIPVAKVTPTP